MDSGIYRLTYRTGETYVGKSIHLNMRWKQHFDKLSKGKAAVNMQDAYHASDHEYPRTEVLLYCHPDLLDYYEGYFINHLKPPLNTSIPEELPEESKEVLVSHYNKGRAKFSVVDLISIIEEYKTDEQFLNQEKSELAEKFEELESDYHELSESWADRATRDNWASEDYVKVMEGQEELEAYALTLEVEVESLQAWRFRVERASWWQRLWRSW